MRRVDVAIVGGGPAGLAAAIEATRRGLSVVVFERRGPAPDKACGEGLMPAGWRALEALGVASRLGEADRAAFAGIRYLQENGTIVEGRFRHGSGVGIRRIALSAAMEASATAAGAVVRHGTPVADVSLAEDCIRLSAGGEPLEARLLVAADGLASPLRKQLGLDGDSTPSRRFGLRQHFRGVHTSGFVDVHWCPDAEAYVTPVGADRCGVAFLFDARRIEKPTFELLLTKFPLVAKQLAGAVADSEARGAGPLLRKTRGCVRGRVVLLGDAAGYVDAITGEGLSLAFESARKLGAILPEALRNPAALSGYERQYLESFDRYATVSQRLVWLANHPRLRRAAFNICGVMPSIFEGIVQRVSGAPPEESR